MGEPASCAGLERGSQEYERLKEERSQVLWRAVEEVIPDIRKRTEVEMVGQTPLLTVCSFSFLQHRISQAMGRLVWESFSWQAI